MSKINIVRRCFNCGAVLQDKDAKKPGYIDPKIFEKDSYVYICKDCFEQSQFNLVSSKLKASDEFLTMLKDAKAMDAMIIYVIDLFSFESSFIEEVTDLLSGLNVLVIANKRDLLPSDYPDEKIKEYVAHRFRVAKIKVEAKDVELASLTSMTDISSLVDRILNQRKRHDIYVIGAVGAGKTLLLTSFLRNYSNVTKRTVSTQKYPETSLRVMQIPLDSSTTIFDSPGMSLENSILSKVDSETARLLSPSSPLEHKNISLNKNESLFFGGLAKIDLLEGNKENITCYTANTIDITKHSDCDDKVFINEIKKGTVYPSSKLISSLTDFDAYDVEVDEKGNRDIGIEGLGWISFKGNKQKFRIFVPKGVSVYSTRAKLDYEA